MDGHLWRFAYLLLNVDRPFNRGLTNLTVIQKYRDNEKAKYLSHDKNAGPQSLSTSISRVRFD